MKHSLQVAKCKLTARMHTTRIERVVRAARPRVSETFWPTCWHCIEEGQSRTTSVYKSSRFHQRRASFILKLALNPRSLLISVVERPPYWQYVSGFHNRAQHLFRCKRRLQDEMATSWYDWQDRFLCLKDCITPWSLVLLHRLDLT